MDRNRKLIYGGITFVAVLVVIVVAFVIARSSEHKIDDNNIVSEKDRVVANMIGHLELIDHDNAHQVLDINEIWLSKTEPDATSSGLTLRGDQFNFDIAFTMRPGEDYEFRNLAMYFRAVTDPERAYSKICDFDKQFILSMPKKMRYSCKRRMSHLCSKNGKPVAKLVLESFELEFDGNPSNVERHQFSKQAWVESCEHWDT